MIAQLKKGVLEFCVLTVVSQGEYYGYEIMKRITSAFEDTSEQTVYTILRRLLADGYTECFSMELTKESPKGPPRKYYRLTKRGKEYLERCRADWASISEIVKIIDENK